MEYCLVPLREEDMELIMKWRNEQIDVLRQKKPLTKDQQHDYFNQVVMKSFRDNKPDCVLFSFLINYVCIGYGGLVHIDWKSKTAELSFIVDTNRYTNKNLYESLSAYGVGSHRHNSEIEQEINKVTNKKFNFTFTPHLTPMFRGILSTIYVDSNRNISIYKIYKCLKQNYKNKPFVKVLKNNTLISTNDVINTNYCFISICKTKYKNKYIILSAIDNLIKGGAGQAIQNMNIKYGFAESRGLK